MKLQMSGLEASINWNVLVSLSFPRLEQVMRAVGVVETSPVFPHNTRFVVLTNSLFASTIVAEPASPNASVISVSLVIAPDFFQDPTTVRTVSIRGLSLLGQALPCAASTFLIHLKKSGLQFCTSVGHRGYQIHVEQALGLLFQSPYSGATPEECELSLISYYFNFGYPSPSQFHLSYHGA